MTEYPESEDFRLRLEQGLGEIGIPLDSLQVEALVRYARELKIWNERINLIGDPDILYRHLLDSLAAYHVLVELHPVHVCDVGTGAGLPGIPLAIVLKDVCFALNDKMGKRMGFLRNMLPLLGLSKRVELLNCPVEQVKDSFDLVTIRAFKGFPGCVEQLSRVIGPEGHLAAYLGEELPSGDYRVEKLDYSFLKGTRHLGVMSRSQIDRLLASKKD